MLDHSDVDIDRLCECEGEDTFPGCLICVQILVIADEIPRIRVMTMEVRYTGIRLSGLGRPCTRVQVNDQGWAWAGCNSGIWKDHVNIDALLLIG